MNRDSISKVVGFILIILAFYGCGKRYWFRLKLDGSSVKRHSVKVNVVNHSPQFLSDRFEQILKQGAMKELKKFGYYDSGKDSTDCILVLQIAVDSFNMVLYNQQNKVAMYADSIVAAPNIYVFNKTVRAILMQCDMMQRKPLRRKWTTYEDIYYFDDFRRDVGRSEGVVRYIIRNGCEEEEKKSF